jgi:drug/metabolite transporter (DMT)-like permease
MAATNKRPKQCPKREVEEGKGHAATIATLASTSATPILAPFTSTASIHWFGEYPNPQHWRGLVVAI